MIHKEKIQEALRALQLSICNQLEECDGTSTFVEDSWIRPGGGGGHSRVIQDGSVFEKGGVNFSAVWGQTPKPVQEQLGVSESDFFATGVSIVIHTTNPFLPIIHMNVRYFEMSNGTCWFGGGIDLTPHYVNKDDATYFHKALKQTCDAYDSSFYPRFKKNADDYFFLKHRNETRGIGGIFFDHLVPDESMSKDRLFEFILAVGNTFAPTYTYIINQHRNTTFDHSNKRWQEIRRSRYVEFNLLYDKGTKFGLDTDGRTESILMSMPPTAAWQYMFSPEPDSEEEKTTKLLSKNIDWV